MRGLVPLRHLIRVDGLRVGTRFRTRDAREMTYLIVKPHLIIPKICMAALFAHLADLGDWKQA